MYVCLCSFMHMCIPVHVCLHLYACICSYIYMCVPECTCVYSFMHMHVILCIHMCVFLYAHICIPSCMHVHVPLSTYMYSCMHVYVCVCMHIRFFCIYMCVPECTCVYPCIYIYVFLKACVCNVLACTYVCSHIHMCRVQRMSQVPLSITLHSFFLRQGLSWNLALAIFGLDWLVTESPGPTCLPSQS